MKEIIKEINPFNNIESDNKILFTIKVLLKTFLVYFIGIIASGIVVTIAATICGIDPSFEKESFNVMLLFKYYGYIGVIAAFIIFVKKFSKMKLEEIGINKNIKSLFKGLFYGSITLIIILGILLILKEIKFIGLNKDINYKLFVLFIGAWLIQSIMEEIICRGYLFHKLKSKLPIVLAIIINFLFFFVGHVFELFNNGVLLGIIGSINLLLPSIIWSLMVIKNKNIHESIGFHYIWNFALYNIIGLNVSGIESNISLFNFTSNNSFLTGASYGIESSIITTIILSVIILILYKRLNKQK